MRNALKNVAVVLVVSAVLSLLSFAGDRGPSTPEERARAVKAAELLQSDPLSPAAKSERAWAITWLIEVPDVGVSVCLHPNEPKKYKFQGELTAAQMTSMASYVIQNPDKAKDNAAMWHAGTMGMLKAYEAMVKENAKARNAYYDALLQQRDSDGLAKYIEELKSHCNSTPVKIETKK